MSPFALVPRGLLGWIVFPSCLTRSNGNKELAATEICEAIVTGPGLSGTCDDEGERAYTAYAPHLNLVRFQNTSETQI